MDEAQNIIPAASKVSIMGKRPYKAQSVKDDMTDVHGDNNNSRSSPLRYFKLGEPVSLEGKTFDLKSLPALMTRLNGRLVINQSGIMEFHCRLCSSNSSVFFSDPVDLRSHVREDHPTYYKCPLCEQGAGCDRDAVMRHLYQDHGDGLWPDNTPALDNIHIAEVLSVSDDDADEEENVRGVDLSQLTSKHHQQSHNGSAIMSNGNVQLDACNQTANLMAINAALLSSLFQPTLPTLIQSPPPPPPPPAPFSYMLGPDGQLFAIMAPPTTTTTLAPPHMLFNPGLGQQTISEMPGGGFFIPTDPLFADQLAKALNKTPTPTAIDKPPSAAAAATAATNGHQTKSQNNNEHHRNNHSTSAKQTVMGTVPNVKVPGRFLCDFCAKECRTPAGLAAHKRCCDVIRKSL